MLYLIVVTAQMIDDLVMWNILWKLMVLFLGSIFREFEEGPITFPPTYKYDPGTQRFDTSHKQRAPAYTDRILFKSKGSSRRRDSSSSTSAEPLECLMYTSVPSICTSDHKPVWGLYRSTVRPGIDTWVYLMNILTHSNTNFLRKK